MKKTRRLKKAGNKTKKTRKTKKQYFFNPANPDKSFDVYINKNPADTISIKYTTVDDVKATIRKLERLYKEGKYPHKRIWQVGMIMKVRLEVLKDLKPAQFALSKRYFEFLSGRTKLDDDKRYKATFKI
jgi:benzoyl-CoA reductase/2-hydroxyglutaryl-CoA dehydratase subunit BcrC/BadD/HgdB